VSLFPFSVLATLLRRPIARRLLKSLSIKQGLKYDDPESARDIPAFIEFHGLNMDEVLEPLENFSTFKLLLNLGDANVH
jgi:hypothetical protein